MTILTLPNSWREIQPDTIYQTADGRQVTFGEDQIQLGITYDRDGKHLRAIEKGRVLPKGNNGLVPSQGGERRFHGKLIDGVLHFPGKITEH